MAESKEFGKLTVIAQKVYYGTDTDKHGARLDVYLDEDATCVEAENGTIYDIEPDKNDDSVSGQLHCREECVFIMQ